MIKTIEPESSYSSIYIKKIWGINEKPENSVEGSIKFAKFCFPQDKDRTVRALNNLYFFIFSSIFQQEYFIKSKILGFQY